MPHLAPIHADREAAGEFLHGVGDPIGMVRQQMAQVGIGGETAHAERHQGYTRAAVRLNNAAFSRAALPLARSAVHPHRQTLVGESLLRFDITRNPSTAGASQTASM